MTTLTKKSGRTELELALDACRAALADANIASDRVDAVLTYHLNDSAPVNAVAGSLGTAATTWTNEFYGGGSQAASILGDAAALIEAGIASTVLIYRALNGRSGKRMGQAPIRLGAGEQDQFTLPYGLYGPVHLFALSAQRWLHERGASESDLAAVVTQSRAHALNNPLALMRESFSEQDHASSPYVAAPLRRVDCCQESDGAAALVVTRTDVAEATRPGSPRIHAVVRGGGEGASSMDKAADPTKIFSAHTAGPLYDAAGMSPTDIDVAQLYDAYSHLVLAQLEDFGLCAPGESGAFVRDGQTSSNGRVPVNLNGGLLSEGYVHGLNNVLEAVRQLRGDGSTQVAEPQVALCTGFGGSFGSAAVLVRP